MSQYLGFLGWIMKIAEKYSFNGGLEYIQVNHQPELNQLISVVERIDAEACRLKKPEKEEISRADRVGVEKFFSPIHFNALFDYFLINLDWELKPRIYTNDASRAGFREMDFVKNHLGLEIQFGKYSFLTYDIVAKMIIFKNYGVINCGVEICPMSSMLPHMSSGIGAYEQVKWDLESRGFVKDFDIPVLVLGVEDENFYNDRISQLHLFPSTVAERVEGTVARNRVTALTEKEMEKVRATGIEIG